jgi:hypothetical protein
MTPIETIEPIIPVITKTETIAMETQTEGFFVLKPEEENF